MSCCGPLKFTRTRKLTSGSFSTASVRVHRKQGNCHQGNTGENKQNHSECPSHKASCDGHHNPYRISCCRSSVKGHPNLNEGRHVAEPPLSIAQPVGAAQHEV